MLLLNIIQCENIQAHMELLSTGILFALLLMAADWAIVLVFFSVSRWFSLSLSFWRCLWVTDLKCVSERWSHHSLSSQIQIQVHCYLSFPKWIPTARLKDICKMKKKKQNQRGNYLLARIENTRLSHSFRLSKEMPHKIFYGEKFCH